MAAAFQVFTTPDIRQYIFRQQEDWKGYRKYKDWTDGDLAAQLGYLSMIREKGDKLNYTNQAMEWAAANGYLEVVQLLYHNLKSVCIADALIEAAKNGHLEIVKWLHYRRMEGSTTWAMDEEAATEYLKIELYMYEFNKYHHRYNYTFRGNWLKANHQVKFFRWLNWNRIEGCTIRAMCYATKYGHHEIVQWLSENRSKGCIPEVIEYITIHSNIELPSDYSCTNEDYNKHIINQKVRQVYMQFVEWCCDPSNKIYYKRYKPNI